ncbi:MAG: B12-binding domain-containing radical SAM protein [Candidatus Omnitrophica bacterium]|nr:B12-binding domain-containing radical SAM protein [Candidatus Omnitrophota bacterium]
MNNILLVYPKTGLDIKNVFTKPPLSFLALAPYLLEKGFSVKIIDQRVDSDWKGQLYENLRNRPLCVGISSMSGPQIAYGLVISRMVKDFCARIPVVWGGAHPTILPEQTLQSPYIDIVVAGEGEETFSETAQALSRGKELDKVKGIYFKKDGKPIFSGYRELLDINTLPPMPYHLVDIDNYVLTSVLGKRNLMIVPDRGCPMRCGFCSVPHFYRYKVRLARPEKIIEDIKSVMKFGVDTVDIGSENFFPNKQRVKDFCRLVKKEKLNIQLRAECRADYILEYDDALLKLMREAGFIALQIGAESGSNRILELMNKGITVEQTKEADRKLKRAGIAGLYSFMIGFPGETLEDVQRTVDLAIQLADNNAMARTYNLQIYKPFPATALYERCLEYGFQEPESLEGWSHILDVKQAWLSARERRLLKMLDLFSYFFDEKGIGEFLNNRFISTFLLPYSKFVKFRCKNAYYNLLLEYPLVNLLKRYT